VLGAAVLTEPLDGQLDVVPLNGMRGEAGEVQHVDREAQGLVRVPPLATRRIPADQHVVEPQQHLTVAGRWLCRKDDVDAFVGVEIVELDFECAGHMRVIAVTVIAGPSVDLDRSAGTAGAGRGDGEGCGCCHSHQAYGRGDGDPHGSGHRGEMEAIH
jgi:hypothetical protein